MTVVVSVDVNKLELPNRLDVPVLVIMGGMDEVVLVLVDKVLVVEDWMLVIVLDVCDVLVLDDRDAVLVLNDVESVVVMILLLMFSKRVILTTVSININKLTVHFTTIFFILFLFIIIYT